MTTARQIRNLVKPLLERHPDLALLSSNVLWITPVRHEAMTILIDRCGFKEMFDVQAFMRQLYLPEHIPMYGLSRAVTRCHRSDYNPNPAGFRTWKWTDPAVVEAFLNCVENHLLPELRAVTGVREGIAYVRACERRMMCQWPDWHIATAIAVGDLEAAQTIWREQVAPCVPNQNVFRGDQQLFERMRALADPLMSGDRAALARLLHDWEAENVRGSVLEPYWQPSPFPFETG
ncbi:hypothetical protein [Methylobacterium sp. A54F]